MFVYTVYPMPGAARKKPARRVESATKTKAASRADRGRFIQYGAAGLLQQANEIQEITLVQSGIPHALSESERIDIARKRADWEHAMGESYAQKMPMLLAWRRPRSVVPTNFIDKYHGHLRAVRAKNDRGKVKSPSSANLVNPPSGF